MKRESGRNRKQPKTGVRHGADSDQDWLRQIFEMADSNGEAGENQSIAEVTERQTGSGNGKRAAVGVARAKANTRAVQPEMNETGVVMVGSYEPSDFVKSREELMTGFGELRSVLSGHVQLAKRGQMLVPFTHVFAYGRSLAIFTVCVTSGAQDSRLTETILTAARAEAYRQRFRIHESVLVVQSLSGVNTVGDERLSKYVSEFGIGPLDHFVCIREPVPFSLN